MNHYLLLGALILIVALAGISGLQNGAALGHALLFTALSAAFFASDGSLWRRERP